MIDISKIDYCPLKPSATFQLRPSLGSAFQPLCRTPGPDEGLSEAAGGEVECEAGPSSQGQSAATLDSPAEEPGA